ncbi:transporter substrate-binding domain-containing protein [Agrobacterium vitis]|uniref:Amino acid ABC transporter n=1 Tax=Agrobacterium vitis TaxID=373 RepID=A0A368NW91_AGRVI|nr:amino acid ABC transporter [Agrobacterium vitis]KAA3521838.1 amino acid ABC transporter [Agrobacterium vitis]MCF1480028.1 transporter substrate-binding domain-containing protein [Agrobacterium vitis]MUZ98378.1 transporter substrate-binding domain-containing protein [Agrobacterium vitis]MVA32796.1 transporter substrate-binding domain-containing protein [Agrobacterium vitis]
MIMSRLKVTSLKTKGRMTAITVLAAFACGVVPFLSLGLAPLPVQAQALPSQQSVPVLFDARARLPKPDLSVLLRLRFLTTVDFPPFSFLDQTGHLTGYNIDLVREICRELDVEAKCEVQAVPFSDMEIALLSKHGDAAVAGMAVTAGLRRDFAFSRPYLMLPARFIVLRDTLGKADTPAALAGKPVGIVTGTAQEAMLKAFFPAIVPVGFADQAALMDALKQKKIQAAFADGLQLSFWLASNVSAQCCVFLGGPFLSQQFLGEGMTIMVRKEDGFLAAAFDYALVSLSRKGRLDELSRRYFAEGFY